MDEEDPKLNHLNCTGNEDSIEDCLSNIATAETCSSAVVLCQGIYTRHYVCKLSIYIYCYAALILLF